MKRNCIVAGLLGLTLLTTGCAALLVGAGAGMGVYSYTEGELRRTYHTDFAAAREATRLALEHLRIRVASTADDGIQEVFKAKRGDGTPVTVKITRLAPDIIEIGVRSGVVGLWDKDVSELIHATIAPRIV